MLTIIILALVLIFAVMNINAGKTNKSNEKGKDDEQDGDSESHWIVAIMSLCRQYIISNFFRSNNSILNFISNKEAARNEAFCF
jgi:hypothetical protein